MLLTDEEHKNFDASKILEPRECPECEKAAKNTGGSMDARPAKLEGERLFLRNQTPEDEARVRTYSSSRELDAIDPTIGETHDPIFYSIVTNDGIHIGFASAYNYSGVDVELGIRIWNRNYWDKGYGTETLRLLVDWAFKSSLINTIIVKVVESNMRARRCYEKCGFVEYARGPLEGHNMVWMQKVRETTNEDKIPG